MKNEAHDGKAYKQELLDLTRRIDEVLTSSGIEYFGVFGTCLGAVREGGIIPWDDDVDIAVRRRDYERAIEVLGNSERQIYVKRTNYRYGRIFNRVSTNDILEKKRAYVDLYIIDSAQESFILFNISVLWYVGITRILARREGCLGNCHPFLYMIADIVAFPLRILPNIKLEKLAQRCYVYDKNSKFVKLSYDANRKRYPAEIFSQTLRVKFADFSLCIPKGHAEYLRLCYGNWEQPPPDSERISHAFSKDGKVWSVALPDESDRRLLIN